MVYFIVYDTSLAGFVSATFIEGTALVSCDDLLPADFTPNDLHDDDEAVHITGSLSFRELVKDSSFIVVHSRELISNLLLTDLPPPLYTAC